MENTAFETSANPVVQVVNVGGDLRITGWEQPQFVAETDDDNKLNIDRDGDQIIVRSASDCTIRLPHGAQVSIQTVGGDARLKSLEQKVSVDNVGGDLVLRQISGAEVRVVGGDLSAKRVAGDLQVGSVGGDLEAKIVIGAFKCSNVGGDLYLIDVGGDLQAASGGDLTLSVNFLPEHEYSALAGGDLTCRQGPEASVRLTLLAGGDISLDLKPAQVEGGANRKTVTLGAGAAQASLRAGGDLNLTGLSFDSDAMGDFGENFGPMAEEFTAHFEAQMADFEKQMSELRAGLNFGPERADVEKITAHARRAAERVQRAAQQKAESARRQAEREAERARRMAEAAQRRAEAMQRKSQNRHSWAFRFDPSRPPVPPRPAASARPAAPGPQSDPVSDEERMVILRMVEQGKISVDEAEKLLAALENK